MPAPLLPNLVNSLPGKPTYAGNGGDTFTPSGDLKLDDTPIVLDALSLRTMALPDVSYANGVKLAAALNTGLTADDDYDAVSAASSLVSVLAPALNETVVGAGLNALILGNGKDPIQEKDKALKASVSQFKQATGNRVEEALGVASATTQLTLIYRAVVNAGYQLAKYGVKLMGHVPSLADEAAGLATIGKTLAASPAGRCVVFINHWLPLLNATWILMAASTAFQVFRSPRSSVTSQALACANIGIACGVVFAGIQASCPAFFATVIGGLLVELALATSRQVDATTGDADARLAFSLKHPIQGLQSAASWLGLVFKTLGKQKVDQAKSQVEKVAPPKISGKRELVKRQPAA